MASIKISRGNDVLFETWASGEENITSLASAIRTVQKESNVFLTKMVEEEKASNNNKGKQSGDKNDDEEDEDADSDEDEADKEDKSDNTKAEVQKKRSTNSPSSNNAKKLCQDK